MSRIAVLGAGSWGTALAIHLARHGRETVLWARRDELAAELRAARSNPDYLPGWPFPEALEVTGNLEAALAGRSLVLFVVPAQFTRALARRTASLLAPDADRVVASKGIELGTGLRLTEVMEQEAAGPGRPISVLSGPSFALEVARGDPTAIVAASPDSGSARKVQAALSAGSLRVYRNPDPVGVEVAGALKNVMAIATGIAEGLGFGFNTRAALITRGLAEITRLGIALGGQPATFAGLAGAGDLVLTCTGGLSRNRSLGMDLGRGRSLEEALRGQRTVAEGAATTRATMALAARAGVEMPLTRKVEQVLYEGLAPREAVTDLLARPLKEEG